MKAKTVSVMQAYLLAGGMCTGGGGNAGHRLGVLVTAG